MVRGACRYSGFWERKESKFDEREDCGVSECVWVVVASAESWREREGGSVEERVEARKSRCE